MNTLLQVFENGEIKATSLDYRDPEMVSYWNLKQISRDAQLLKRFNEERFQLPPISCMWGEHIEILSNSVILDKKYKMKKTSNS